MTDAQAGTDPSDKKDDEVVLTPRWDSSVGEFVWSAVADGDEFVSAATAQGRMAGSGWEEIDAYFSEAEQGGAQGKSLVSRPGGELIVVDGKLGDATEVIGNVAQGRMA